MCGIIKGQFTCSSLPSRSFYRIFNILLFLSLFPFTSYLDEKNGEIPVYKSEVTKNGMWKPFELDVTLFCNGDMVSLRFRSDTIEPTDHHQDVPLQGERRPHSSGRTHRISSHSIPPKTSTSKLIAASSSSLPLASLSLSIPNFLYQPRPSFLHYLQSGLDLNFMVAIDLTGSNGNPSFPDSLHYFNPSLYAQGRLNPYETAILAVGHVLEYYDTDRRFPTYGFGACPAGFPTANHCFALNGNEGYPEVEGVAGIMEVYHRTLTAVRFSGPTLFEYVLGKAVG